LGVMSGCMAQTPYAESVRKIVYRESSREPN